MSPRFYLRTMSDLGPMYYAGQSSGFWLTSPAWGGGYESAADAREVRERAGLPRSAVRVVRVGPKRRPSAATETARQRVDGTTDGSKGVQGLAARPEGVCSPSPERVTVTGAWCGDSPTHEHAWQWRDGGLVCAHCGGRRAEARA